MYFAASVQFISYGRTSFPEKEMVILFCYDIYQKLNHKCIAKEYLNHDITQIRISVPDRNAYRRNFHHTTHHTLSYLPFTVNIRIDV